MASLLILSFASLLTGPLILQLAKGNMNAVRFIDAFVLCSVFGIVGFHVLPESLHHGGFLAAAAAGLGFFAPVAAGRLLKSGGCHLHHSLLSLASVGLLAHALLDGMALSDSTTNFVLGLAVVLHRLPEGMGIWRLMHGESKKLLPSIVLLVVALATTAGFFFGESILHYASEQMLAIFEGLMAGVLMHVIFHRHHIEEFDAATQACRKMGRVSMSLGALCGLALVVALFVTQPNGHSHAHTIISDEIDR